MFKKFLLIGVLGISMFALLAPEAMSRCRIVCWPYCSDFCVATCLTGVKPEDTRLVNQVAIKEAGVFCQNKGGNNWDPTVGNPFAAQQTIVFAEHLTSDYLKEVKGSACVGLDEDPAFCLSGEDIYTAIKDAIPPPEDPLYPCKENNWTVVENNATILMALMYSQTYQNFDKDEDGCWDLSDAVCQECTRVLDEEGNCSYDCTTIDDTVCIDAGLGDLQDPDICTEYNE